MNRLKLPFQDRRELPSAQHVSVEITIDDDADEDEEPVVVSNICFYRRVISVLF